MKALIAIAASLLLVTSCTHPKGPPPVYHITSTIPAGSRIECFAQIHDESWKPTQQINRLTRDMSVKEAEKWAISAANTRLGKQWKDYCFRVIPPDHQPVVVFARRIKTVHL